jgi:sugar lactone lactonase YvrE
MSIPFTGSVLSSTVCKLGEGPSHERETGTLWWFDILGKTLHERELETGQERHHPLPMMASVVARIDADRQMLATEKGIYIRQRHDGTLAPYCELEPGNTSNRSNDGRVHPSGSLWIGTMGKGGEDRAGAIYHVASGTVTKLFADLSIPNAICFSPDGSIGYFVDTTVNRLMQVPLDTSTGLPTGPASLLVDTSHRPGGMDGAVCDSDGNIWNARWGAGAVDCYAPDGTHLDSYALPAQQVSCPVFHGHDLRNLAVTSAWEGLNTSQREEDKQAGELFNFQVSSKGVPEPSFNP